MSGPRTTLSPEQFLVALNTSTEDLSILAELFREVEMCFMARYPQFKNQLLSIYEQLLEEYKKPKPDISKKMHEIGSQTYSSDMTWAWRINYDLTDSGCKERRTLEDYSNDLKITVKDQLSLRIYNLGYALKRFPNQSILCKYLTREVDYYKNLGKESKQAAEEKLHVEVTDLKPFTDKYNDIMAGSREQVLAKIDKVFSENKELNQDFADSLALNIFVGRDIRKNIHDTQCIDLHPIIVNFLSRLQAQAVKYIERIQPKPAPVEQQEIKPTPPVMPTTTPVAAVPATVVFHTLPVKIKPTETKEEKKIDRIIQTPDYVDISSYLFVDFCNIKKLEGATKKAIIAKANLDPARAQDIYKTFKRAIEWFDNQIKFSTFKEYTIDMLERKLLLCNLINEMDALKTEKKQFNTHFWQKKKPLGILLAETIKSINDDLRKLNGVKKLVV